VINFLYCFDENYNYQAFSSIISLLDNIDENINIYVIHKVEEGINFFPKKILNHKNLNILEVYKFKNDTSKYPNLNNAHVSEATYYRLFCEEYLPEMESVFYIDADIICVNNPLNLISENTRELLKSKFVISAKTEVYRSSNNDEVFDRLELQSKNYFNAGVMNINLKKWKRLNYDYYNLFEKVGHKLNYWDQDLLNYLFDGDFFEMNPKLNKVVDFSHYEFVKNLPPNEVIISTNLFLHFAGSHKPWSVNGIMVKISDIYQKEFRKISKSHFHITHKIRSYSLYVLYRNIFNGKFFKLRNKFLFITDLIKSLLKVKIKTK